MFIDLPPEIICIISLDLPLMDYNSLLLTCRYVYFILKGNCKLTKAAKIIQKYWKNYLNITPEVRFKRKLFKIISYNYDELTKISSENKWGILLRGDGTTIHALTYTSVGGLSHMGVLLGIMNKYQHLEIVNNSAEQVKLLDNGFDKVVVKRRKLNLLNESPFTW